MSETKSGRSLGGQLEEKIDLSSETSTKITQAQSLASSNNLREALSLLFALEKRCRVGNDTSSLVRVCEASLDLCKECNDEESIIATLKHLSTRRSQKSKAVSALMEKAMPWVLEEGTYVPKEGVEKIVLALRDITEGKIFLEGQRARLTRGLASIMEGQGKISEAADVLQEVHVETYGSLSKREKVEFILEQMRLTLLKQDYIRAAIVSRKINQKVIAEKGMEEEKIKFFTLMTEYHRQEKDAFELAKDYYHIYSTSSVQEEEEKWVDALRNTVLFLVLSPYSNEQQDMMNRINLEPKLEKIEACNDIIKLFLKKEIINYPTAHQDTLESLPSFSLTSLSSHWHKTFHTRIVQHNIRVASVYYRCIHGKRLAGLLNLDPATLEKEISSMVSDGSVYAKIDRPKDIIRFTESKSPEKILSDWSGDIKTLLDLVEKTNHLIHKENMTQ